MLQKARQWLHFSVGFLNLINLWGVVPAIVALVLADIFMRAFFSAPISWVHEVLGLLLLCLLFLGLPRCLQHNELLQVDLMFDRFSYRARRYLEKLSYGTTMVLALIIAWQGIVAAIELFEYGDSTYHLEIPYWPFSCLIAFSGVVMALQIGIELFFRQSNAPRSGATL